MKQLNNYILEKLHLDKDIDHQYNEVTLDIFKKEFARCFGDNSPWPLNDVFKYDLVTFDGYTLIDIFMLKDMDKLYVNLRHPNNNSVVAKVITNKNVNNFFHGNELEKLYDALKNGVDID